MAGQTPRALDCLIIGGGPAGLTAAIYLARFHLTVAVIDGGNSRAALIPQTRNHAGFPDGIAGAALLDRMRAQAIKYGAEHHAGLVHTLEQTKDGILAQCDQSPYVARAVLLATGVVNHRPAMMDDAAHDRALASGLIRYCPICDGFEVTDKQLAVLGTGGRGVKEAIFLRSYTRHVTLVAPQQGHTLTADHKASLEAAGITLGGPCDTVRIDDDKIVVETGTERMAFDSLYPALGSNIRSELAGMLGAKRTDEGCLLVDAHQRTDVTGLYAAGDVVLGLDQISHAMGEGGVAATTIRNDLAAAIPLRR